MRQLPFLPLAGCVLFLAAAPAFAQQQNVPTVATVGAQMKPVTKRLDFVGRVEAINRVEIRARVKGFLDAVLFKEGDTVKEGAVLYRIEKGLFEAAVQQSEGVLERSNAALALAKLQRARAEELVAKEAGTVAMRDQRVAEESQAKGAITSSKADLTSARINLGYTEITAPVTGKIGRTAVTKGNVVSPDSGVLTTIVSQDPIYVTFPVSQRELLHMRASGRTPDLSAIRVSVRFPDGTVYDQKGKVDFLDVSVDRGTDTLLARAVFPNPVGTLVDGQLVEVGVESGAPQEKLVIPQTALISDQEGAYVFAVEDGKAVIKRVKLGGPQGTSVIIEEGLKPGDLIIVEGLQSVRPGSPVRTTPLMTSIKES